MSKTSPIRDPSSDIFRRRSFDLNSITNSNVTVALSPAILAALIGQTGAKGGIIGAELHEGATLSLCRLLNVAVDLRLQWPAAWSMRLMRIVLTMMLLVVGALPVSAAWICDGDRMTAEPIQLGRDAIGATAQPIPNSSQGTVPGDVILLRWRGVTLQLPRTNNAGAPSYTDGRWWWQVEDPDHPDFRQRRGTVVAYDCSPE